MSPTAVISLQCIMLGYVKLRRRPLRLATLFLRKCEPGFNMSVGYYGFNDDMHSLRVNYALQAYGVLREM